MPGSISRGSDIELRRMLMCVREELSVIMGMSMCEMGVEDSFIQLPHIIEESIDAAMCQRECKAFSWWKFSKTYWCVVL